MGARSEWAPPQGLVEFPQGGTCRVTADSDALILIAEATTTAQLARIQSILTADIQRFGQCHNLIVTWSSAPS